MPLLHRQPRPGLGITSIVTGSAEGVLDACSTLSAISGILSWASIATDAATKEVVCVVVVVVLVMVVSGGCVVMVALFEVMLVVVVALEHVVSSVIVSVIVIVSLALLAEDAIMSLPLVLTGWVVCSATNFCSSIDFSDSFICGCCSGCGCSGCACCCCSDCTCAYRIWDGRAKVEVEVWEKETENTVKHIEENHYTIDYPMCVKYLRKIKVMVFFYDYVHN